MDNPVVHFEIAGPDGPALQQFYRDLFGWKIEEQSLEMGNYALVAANEGGVGGGLLTTTEDMPERNYVSFYVQVEDIEAALAKLSGLGGKPVVPRVEIAPGMGWIAMFIDPENNPMGLYSPPLNWDGQMPPKGNGPPAAHFEVGGSDAAKLAEFYAEMFDWKITLQEESGYRFIEKVSRGIGGGIFQHQEGMPTQASAVAVAVDDLQGYLDKAVSLGGSVLMPPFEIPGGFGSAAIFFDIAGNRVSLFKPAEQ